MNGIVSKEGDEEKGILPGTVRIDSDFTLEAMRNALESDFPVIHIASHFVFNPTDKESFLLLGDGSDSPSIRSSIRAFASTMWTC